MKLKSHASHQTSVVTLLVLLAFFALLSHAQINKVSNTTCSDGLDCVGNQLSIGQVTPQRCSLGLYCPNNPNSTEYAQTLFILCKRGAYCPKPTELDPCPKGHWCPTGSSTPTPCEVLSICPMGAYKSRWFLPLLCGGILAFLLFAFLGLNELWRRKSGLDRPKHSHSQVNPSANSDIKDKSNSTPKFDISFRNIVVEVNANGTMRTILRGASGDFRSGKLTAIMGCSGSGKTTLVSALRGQIPIKSGQIYVNGVFAPSFLQKFKKSVGFVPQSDTMLEALSVRETLIHSAETRLPASWSEKRKADFVDDALRTLGLDHIKDSLIGDEVKRGISGGQKKRVNIGIELVAKPTILFADEPSTGLDATAAQEVVMCLRRIAERGVPIVSIIHQPRFEIFNMFDDLVLLGNGGRVIYQGNVSAVLPYFASIGYECPPMCNPADYIIDCANIRVMNADGTLWSSEQLGAAWEAHCAHETEQKLIESAMAAEVAASASSSVSSSAPPSASSLMSQPQQPDNHLLMMNSSAASSSASQPLDMSHRSVVSVLSNTSQSAAGVGLSAHLQQQQQQQGAPSSSTNVSLDVLSLASNRSNNSKKQASRPPLAPPPPPAHTPAPSNTSSDLSPKMPQKPLSAAPPALGVQPMFVVVDEEDEGIVTSDGDGYDDTPKPRRTRQSPSNSLAVTTKRPMSSPAAVSKLNSNKFGWMEQRNAAGLFTQISIYMYRTLLLQVRRINDLYVDLGLTIMTGLGMGYARMDEEIYMPGLPANMVEFCPSIIRARCANEGLGDFVLVINVFFLVMVIASSASVQGANTFALDKDVTRREAGAGGNLWAFFLAKVFFDVWNIARFTFIFLCIYYLMASPSGSFAAWYAAIFVLVWSAYGLGYIAACFVKKRENSLVVACVSAVSWSITSGLSPTIPQVESSFGPFQVFWILSYARWSAEALILVATSESYANFDISKYVKHMGYSPGNYYLDIVAAFFVGCGLRLVAFSLLWWENKAATTGQSFSSFLYHKLALDKYFAEKTKDSSAVSNPKKSSSFVAGSSSNNNGAASSAVARAPARRSSSRAPRK